MAALSLRAGAPGAESGARPTSEGLLRRRWPPGASVVHQVGMPDPALLFPHELIAPAFRQQVDSQSAGTTGAAAAAARQCARDGYAILPSPLLTPEGIAYCLQGLERMMSELHPSVGVRDIVSPYQRAGAEWMWGLATNLSVLDLIEATVGPDILLWSGGPGCKEPLLQDAQPEENGAIPWHQDAPYWNVYPAAHAAGLWIAISDVDAENGTMSVLPGAHCHGVLPRLVDEEKLAANNSSGKPVFSDQIDARALHVAAGVTAKAVAGSETTVAGDVVKLPGTLQYNLKAGSAAIHDVLTPHTALPNTSRERWRHVIVLRYCSAAGIFGTKEYTDCFTGERFPREYFLVRGEDKDRRGFRCSPWENAGVPGYIGDAEVDLSRHAQAEAVSRQRLFGEGARVVSKL